MKKYSHIDDDGVFFCQSNLNLYFNPYFLYETACVCMRMCVYVHVRERKREGDYGRSQGVFHMLRDS